MEQEVLYLFKKYAKNNYATFFSSPNENSNYCIYVGKVSKSKDVLSAKSICSQEDMCKFAEKLLGTIEPESDDEKYIINELDTHIYFIKRIDNVWKLWDSYIPNSGVLNILIQQKP